MQNQSENIAEDYVL